MKSVVRFSVNAKIGWCYKTNRFLEIGFGMPLRTSVIPGLNRCWWRMLATRNQHQNVTNILLDLVCLYFRTIVYFNNVNFYLSSFCYVLSMNKESSCIVPIFIKQPLSKKKWLIVETNEILARKYQLEWDVSC